MIQFLAFLTVFALLLGLRDKIKSLEWEIDKLRRRLDADKPIEKLPEVTEELIPAEPHKEGTIEPPRPTPDPALAERAQPVKPVYTPKQPKEPSGAESTFDLFGWIKRYFTEGNVLVRIGGIIFFFGLAFLAKYAAERDLISIEMRLAGIALLGVALISVGWKLREREGGYGLILQGLGIAILYLVVFASAKLYALIPLGLAFIVMFLFVALGSMLAVVQNSLPLALFAITGGFLAPILTSSDSGSHIMLFGYYAFLNAGIVAIAWYRSWRILNITGFLFTFVIATAWGILRYEPSLLNTTEPFLILYYLFYLTISVLFSLKQSFSPRGFIDATLVFGLPLVGFSFQVALVGEIEYAVAYSALALGTVYLVLWKMLIAHEKMKLLAEAFLALGVVFYTIAVPYMFDDELTGALWVLEGAAIVWVSLRQNRPYARLFGQFLQVVATALFILASLDKEGGTAFFNILYLEYLIVFFALMLTAYLLEKEPHESSDISLETSALFILVGLGVWLFAGWIETDKLEYLQGNSMLIYLSIGMLIFSVLSHLLRWRQLESWLQLHAVIGGIFLVTLLPHYEATHPFEGIGWLALLLFFGVLYGLLYRPDEVWTKASFYHIGSLWLLSLIGAKEGAYRVTQFVDGTTWHHVGWLIVPLLLMLIILRTKKFLPAKLSRHLNDYRLSGAGGIAVVVLIWEIIGFSLSGDPTPLPYFPIFNPLDIAQLLGLGAVIYWAYRNELLRDSTEAVLFGLGALLALVLSSVIFARAVHFWMGVEYSVQALGDSMFFQAGLSIIWSLMAMAVMLLAQRYANRPLWIAGMGLLVLVVIKLFFVELANSGTVERIVSFIVVGGLMLLIGYFAPLPPSQEEEKGE